jgi:hypothetical protein
MGAKPYTLATIGDRGAVVEIGSERGEGSTDFLAELAQRHGVDFYSIDIIKRHELTTVADGAEWLASFDGEIQLAYLDNFDYVFPEIEGASWVVEQAVEYESMGRLLTNDNSEAEHLAQAMLVHDLSFGGSVVLIDDTYISDGRLTGKGALAVPWLTEHGWQLVNEIGDSPQNGYAHMRRTT